MKTIIGLFGFGLILISNLIAQESGVFVPDYPIIIPHGYRGSIGTEANGKMYVSMGGSHWQWACYPEQWKLFSNGKGYEVNTGK